ncbi:MAG: YdcF family protein [Planctomycetes bacterium]|nr:YdcF family protein [Planctomycetota bacterium]
MPLVEPPPRRRIRRWLAFAIVLGLALGCYAARRPLLLAVGDWLDVGSPPTRVDYIVSLPGNYNSRPFVAAAWVRAGLARQAWVLRTESLPADSPDPYDIGDYGITLRTLRRFGLTEQQIETLDGQTASTSDDVRLIAERLRREPRATVAIVTNDFHTRRARWTVSRAFADLPNRFIMVSTPTDWYGPDNWWQVREGAVAYLSEYLKLAGYWVAYGAGKWWLALLGGASAVALWRRRAARRTLA